MSTHREMAWFFCCYNLVICAVSVQRASIYKMSSLLIISISNLGYDVSFGVFWLARGGSNRIEAKNLLLEFQNLNICTHSLPMFGIYLHLKQVRVDFGCELSEGVREQLQQKRKFVDSVSKRGSSLREQELLEEGSSSQGEILAKKIHSIF